MYRIRVLNSDGTLGGFFSDIGMVSDPTLANVYDGYDERLKYDISKAFVISGALKQPIVNYGINTLTKANDEKKNFDKHQLKLVLTSDKTIKDIDATDSMKRYLPPFEDKASRGLEDGSQTIAQIGYFEIDGGYLQDQQDLDIDGGYS